MTVYDVCIIGGGASGLIAAISAKRTRPNSNILIIEKNDRVGKKLINTGNGRCNITNTDISADRYYSSNESFFEYFSGFSLNDTKVFFESIGVLLKEEENGKIYPYSLQASSVLDALRYECERLLVEIHCSERVEKFEKVGNDFKISTNLSSYMSSAVIIAAGGAASDKLGGCRDGYNFLKQYSHSCTALYPCITAVKTELAQIKALKGIKSDVNLTLKVGKNKKSEFGEILFTEYGLSGPPVLQLSQMLGGSSNDAQFIIDFMPEYDFENIVLLVKNRIFSVYEDKLENLFVGMLNKRIGQTVIKSAGFQLSDSASKLNEKEIRAIVSKIKKFQLEVTGVRGFEYAQVTGGGIDISKFNNETMQSELCKGLYSCGEVLDITGDCGGFNLQWAWTSGYKAGLSAAKSIKR